MKKSSYGSQAADYTYNLVNLLTEVNNANGSTQILKYSGTSVYRYDTYNRLISYNDGRNEVTYTYSANNLRASKTVNREKTDYVWNGQNLAGEFTADTSNTYTYDVNGIYQADINGAQRMYQKDMHGSVISTRDNSGEYIAMFEFDAFGNQVTGFDTPDPFGYCGEYYDYESGMTYLRARYYDSDIKRFITEDPHWNVDNMIYGDEPKKIIMYSSTLFENIYLFTRDSYLNKVDSNPIPDIYSILQSSNAYAYVLNNPNTYIDTTGYKIEYFSVGLSIGLLTYAEISGGIISDDKGNSALIFGGGVGVGAGVQAGVSYYESYGYETIYDYTVNCYSPTITLSAYDYGITVNEFGISSGVGVGFIAKVAVLLAQGYAVIVEL